MRLAEVLADKARRLDLVLIQWTPVPGRIPDLGAAAGYQVRSAEDLSSARASADGGARDEL
jgi:hypothetical protein